MQQHYRLGLGVLSALAILLVLPGINSAAEGDSGPVSAESVTTGPSTRETLIYLPYQNLRQALEKHGATVVMPFADYEELWKATLGRLLPDDRPPVAGVIAKATYTGNVAQDLVRVQAELEVLVLKDGWAEVPLAFGEAAIGSVTAEPGPVLLRGTGNGTYGLLFSTSGTHRVRMELTSRVRTAPDGKSFELQIPNVAITAFDFSVPESDQTIEVQPKLLQEAVEAPESTTRIRASLGSINKLTARWHPRTGTKPDMELLASASAATAVSVENGLVHADAAFLVEVLRGQLETLRVAIPLGQRVLDVTSTAGIRDWKLEAEPQRQVLTINLLNRQSGKIPLEIHTEWPLTGEQIDAAGLQDGQAFGIHLLDILRESGQIALRTSTDLQMNVTAQQGVARIDEAEADPRLRKPRSTYFRYFTPAVRLTASVRPIEPRLLVDHAVDVVISATQVRSKNLLGYTIERAGLFEIVLELPEGMSLESLDASYLKDYHLSADQRTVTIVLREAKQGEVKVGLVLVRQRDPTLTTEEFPVPLVNPKGVEVENGRLRLLAPNTMELITDSTAAVGLQPDPDPQFISIGDADLVSAWTFQRRPVSMTAKTLLKPTRLTADLGTTLDVRQGQVQVKTALRYDVQFAGLDTFRLAVPEAVADQVQIQLGGSGAPPIRQRTRGTAADGWVPWTVELQREHVGQVELVVSYDLPITQDNAAKVTTPVAIVQALPPFVTIENSTPARVVELARINGEIRVLKDRVLSVIATASGGDVETIDSRELQSLPAEGIAAYRYFKQPISVALQTARFDVQTVVETVVSRGLVEVVVDRSGMALVRARLQVKSSERQRLRVDLPQEIEPLGVELDGKAIALEKNPEARPSGGWDAYFVNVARTKSSDQPFQLTLQYRQPFTPRPFQLSRGGELQVRLPLLGGGDGNVPLQQLRVALWVPKDFAVVGLPAAFDRVSRPTLFRWWNARTRPASNDDNDQWIGGYHGGVFDFPTEGQRYVYSNLGGQSQIKVQWWYLPFYTWIVSGTLVIIAWILRKTSWENKLTMIILAAFLASAYAIRDVDLILHGLAVSVYGLVAMLGLWLVHGWRETTRRTSRRSTNSRRPDSWQASNWQSQSGQTPAAVVIPPPGIFDTVVLGMQKPAS